MDNEVSRISKLEAQVDSLKEDVAEVKSDIKDLHSRITTGNREIMDKIDQKIDALAKADRDQHISLNDSVTDVKNRVIILEKWRWMIMGAALVVGYLLGYIDITKILK